MRIFVDPSWACFVCCIVRHRGFNFFPVSFFSALLSKNSSINRSYVFKPFQLQCTVDVVVSGGGGEALYNILIKISLLVGLSPWTITLKMFLSSLQPSSETGRLEGWGWLIAIFPGQKRLAKYFPLESFYAEFSGYISK